MGTCTEEIRKEACTGCNACVNICPAQAVIMKADREGFWYPLIDQGKCEECGKCATVCPILRVALRKDICSGKDIPEKRVSPIYAAWSLNQEIRYHSTSGGIFSELALSVLANGGYICGAIYDDSHMVKHTITNLKQDVAKLRQSKYVQSDMGNVYQGVEDLLIEEKTVLFCGTPCQCAGISCYCQEHNVDIKNLYLIDFICRGANSPKVYRRFLNEMEERYQSNVKQVWFKNKAYGWNRFSTKIEFENGSDYLQDRYHDVYIRGYIEENLFIRPSCAECRFKGFHRFSDLMLADFWGIRINDDSQDSDGGTSMVMVNTEKGKALWDTISPHVYKEEKSLEEAVSGNVCFYHSIQQGIYREEFMEALDEMPIIDNIVRFLKESN